ncbi:hypothetical protein SUGI_0395510 [Cryptomeria japonica]|nr:hypothetical protein SUGI_0395510 [Cryptomeria japonica]
MERSGGEWSGADKGNGQAQNSNVLGWRPGAASGQQVAGGFFDSLEGEGPEGLEPNAALDLEDPGGRPKSCEPKLEKIGEWENIKLTSHIPIWIERLKFRLSSMKCFHFSYGDKKEEEQRNNIINDNKRKSLWTRSMSGGSNPEGRRAQIRNQELHLENPNSKIEVAVKQLNKKGMQGHKEWVTEVNFLGMVEHRNLVKLVGYCAEDDERGIQRLLVYEFMPNKSLEDHLLSRSLPVLPWLVRLQIALEAASGLAYLHEEMDFQIIFRDFKTSNVLLDQEFHPKLSDFGLARQGPAVGISHVTTAGEDFKIAVHKQRIQIQLKFFINYTL